MRFYCKRARSEEPEQAKEFDPASALQAFEPAHAAPRPTLNSDMLALPSKAALCSPERLVDKQFQGILERIKDIFPEHPVRVKSVRVTKNELHDYAKVVGRMHQCGKLAFMLHPKGVASFFVVAKPNGQQRPIWNGAEISEACRRPVAPPRFGNPASFVDICVAPGSQVFLSKRDASSYFDVLRAPVDEHAWFGFAPLSASLLCETLNMDIEGLRNVVKDPDTILPTTLVYPVSVTFPMGFSWSSCIAQATTISVVKAAGINEDKIICDTAELPEDHNEVAVVATDDIILIHTNARQALERLDAIDAALLEAGIPQAPRRTKTRGARSSASVAFCVAAHREWIPTQLRFGRFSRQS